MESNLHPRPRRNAGDTEDNALQCAGQNSVISPALSLSYQQHLGCDHVTWDNAVTPDHGPRPGSACGGVRRSDQEIGGAR